MRLGLGPGRLRCWATHRLYGLFGGGQHTMWYSSVALLALCVTPWVYDGWHGGCGAGWCWLEQVKLITFIKVVSLPLCSSCLLRHRHHHRRGDSIILFVIYYYHYEGDRENLNDDFHNLVEIILLNDMHRLNITFWAFISRLLSLMFLDFWYWSLYVVKV